MRKKRKVGNKTEKIMKEALIAFGFFFITFFAIGLAWGYFESRSDEKVMQLIIDRTSLIDTKYGLVFKYNGGSDKYNYYYSIKNNTVYFLFPLL